MSDLLALAAVTAVLKRSLENGMVARDLSAHTGGDVLISTLPPDRVATGAEERAQLNLFLYQVTPHTGMRRAEPAGPQSREGRALTLDLAYLVTAYGATDFQSELLLGYALARFHEQRRIERDAIRAALQAVSAPHGDRSSAAPAAALAGSRLAETIERLELSPLFLPLEELSKLWSALQARYRPSLTYKVSLVVLGGDQEARSRSEVAHGRR